MKKLLVLITILIISSTIVSPIFATTDTTVSDVLGSTTETENKNPLETTTISNNALKVEIPTQTDNPSTIITFTNPSMDNAVVQLEMDSKGYVDITSPYTLPALSIGKHTLSFKFQDENASTQLYDTSIIIIPRAPILSTPVIGTEDVTISGSGLANSEVIVLLSSGDTVLTQTVIIDGDGKWTMAFAKSDFGNDIFSLNAYTRRYGYASNLSEVTKFTLDNQKTISNTTNKAFDIRDITIDGIKNWIITNQIYLIIAVSSLLIGIMLGIFFVSQKKQKNEKVVEKKVAEKFVKTDSKEAGVTLREKLMGTGKPTEQKVEEKKEEEKKTEVKPEEKEDERVMNKMDFLKDFKNFDPDNSKGEEKTSSVEVSLTSKK
jgi:hypothetical protein